MSNTAATYRSPPRHIAEELNEDLFLTPQTHKAAQAESEGDRLQVHTRRELKSSQVAPPPPVFAEDLPPPPPEPQEEPPPPPPEDRETKHSQPRPVRSGKKAGQSSRKNKPGAPARETPSQRTRQLLLLPPPAPAQDGGDVQRPRPPANWQEMLGRLPVDCEGQGVRDSLAIQRWAGVRVPGDRHRAQPDAGEVQERVQSLHLLFTTAQALVDANERPRGFLDALHKAYQRGTTADEHMLDPERTVATLACAVGSNISPRQLDRAVTRTRYGAELLRSLVTPLLIYMPLGWGGNSLLAAKWAEDREDFSPNEKFWTTLVLGTLIGLAVFLDGVGRQAGAGPVYTRNVTSREVDGKGREIVPADNFMIGVRSTAFQWFLPGLAMVHRFVRHPDPAEQQESQADARFWVGMLCTLGVALHNYLAPVASGVNTIKALDGRKPEDFRAHVHYMNEPPWRGGLTYFGNLLKGLGRTFWSPDPKAKSLVDKVWSAMPESTTVLRFMLRTQFSHYLLNIMPIVKERLQENHGYSEEEAGYRAGLLAFAGISMGWGPAMELTYQLCLRIGKSAEREKALAEANSNAHAKRLRDAAPAELTPPR